MLEKIKDILLNNSSFGEDEDDSFFMYSDKYLIQTKEETYIGTFDTDSLLEDISLVESAELIGSLIDEYGIVFASDNGAVINIEDIVYFKLVENIKTLADEINNDLDQPQRAISNYLIRESPETKLTQKEFYQMIIDSAQHELNLIRL